MNIDWSKAPENATHAVSDGARIDFVWAEFPKGGGHAVFHAAHDTDGTSTDYYMARSVGWKVVSCRRTYPAQHSVPYYSGEGLPPVGAECLLSDGSEDGIRVKILFHDGCFAVFSHEGEYSGRTAKAFRPIRTPEQIAEQEREDAINGMWAEITAGKQVNLFYDIALQKRVCADLFDRGYRKQVTE